uniref:Phosphoglycolate phosphatase n=1 Tax=Entomoneis paludosa TaxID=265537 RepID=A0A7S2YJ12_9STRA|mmetsp:Transcript_35158/g.73219  ORF Transcript_35158/g.73219 Transcript_35158/m.73219 type:complete len:301 (+) Transcript_35158:80-982(+)
MPSAMLLTFGSLLALLLAPTGIHSFQPSLLAGNVVHSSNLPMAATPDEDATDSSTAAVTAPTTLKAVLFDIDGTLADSWKLGFDATNVVLEKNNIPTIDHEVYHQGTRYTTPDRLARHAGLLPGDEEYSSTGERLGQEFDEFYIGLVSTETAGFYNGIAELLSHVQPEVALGALTNAAVGYAQAVFRENTRSDTLDWSTRFQSIRGADNVPAAKPAPDGLWQVCQDLQVDPQDCVYVGDSPSDGGAALAAGMPFIGVTWGSHGKESLAKLAQEGDNADKVVLCDSVSELQDVLAGYSVLK